MPDVTLDLGNQYIGSAYSPQVAITDTEDGHEVTFTYADSEHPGQLTTASYDVPTYASEEAAREAAEAARAAAESARAAAEQARTAAESARASAEAGRATAEGEREDAETARASAEQARAAAETARASAEGSRATAEQARTSAETARASAEAAREIASATAVHNAEVATAAASAAADRVDAAIADAEDSADAAEDAAASATSAAGSATTAAGAANTAAAAATSAASVANTAAAAADTAREAIQTDLADKADKTGTYSTLIAGGTTPDSITDAMLAQSGGVLETVDEMQNDISTSDYYPDNFNYLSRKKSTLENTKLYSNGNIGASGSDTYAVLRVPVNAGDSYMLTRYNQYETSGYSAIAIQGGSVVFSTHGGTGYGGTIPNPVTTSSNQPFTVPSGVTWAYIMITQTAWSTYGGAMTLQRITDDHETPSYPATDKKGAAYIGPIVDEYVTDVPTMMYELNELTRRFDAACLTGYDVINPDEFEIGNISGSTGANSNNNSCVRSKAISHADRDMTFECPQSYRMGFYFYGSDGTYIQDDLAAEKVRYTVAAGRNYRMRLQAYPADSSVTANVVEYCASVGIETKCVDDAYDSGSIIRMNGDKKSVVAGMSRAAAGQTHPTLTPLEFVHFSDIHTYTEQWKRLVEFMDDNSTYLPFAIHTGDYCGSYQYNYVDLYAEAKPRSGYILNVVGNHDWRLDNEEMAEQSATYAKLFNDTTGWGVTFGAEENAMYYYKDFSGSGIRLVVIDQYYWTQTESDWLDTVLAGARTADLSVVTAAHTQTGPITQVDCTFGRIDDFSSVEVATSQFATNIMAFVSAGGTHICHICGHWHHDEFGRDSNGILNIVVETAASNASDTWRDTLRVRGLRSFDCFNVMSINAENGTIGICRIGNNTDHYGRNKNGLVYDYVHDKLLANY